MIADLITNKWFWSLMGVLSALIFYKLVFRNDKTKTGLEKEYSDVLNSEEYKVKGQYD